MEEYTIPNDNQSKITFYDNFEIFTSNYACIQFLLNRNILRSALACACTLKKLHFIYTKMSLKLTDIFINVNSSHVKLKERFKIT